MADDKTKKPPEEISKATTIGARIKELREASGLSIEKVASISGIDCGTWIDIENDNARIKLSALWRVSIALGVRPRSLFI